MAVRKTKRKAFNFLRSYFDVLNEIPEDKDKLAFLISIINKQFLNEDPENLEFIANLCYESQRHNVEKSVKGWLLANKTGLQGDPTSDPTPPHASSPVSDPKEEQEEEQEQEQEKEEYYTYSENDFLDNWKKCREHFLKKPTNIKKMTFYDKKSFANALKTFNKEEINKAMQGLFKQIRVPSDIMHLQPKHFLENIGTYLNAFETDCKTLYSSKETKNKVQL